MAKIQRHHIYLFLALVIVARWILKPSYVETIQANPVRDPGITIDFVSLYKEGVAHLLKLLAIPTVRKDENKVVDYLNSVFTKEKIKTRLVVHPERKDKVSLIAEIGPVNSKEGIILMGHTDVVEASDSWMYPPFNPKVVDGRIYGRGSLDMKGMLAMEMMTLVALNRQNFPLKNKIMFLAAPDEESGGVYGVQYLLDKYPELFNGYKYVINEGGFGIQNFPSKGQSFFNVQVAEKGVLGLEITASGSSGHASMPPKHYSTVSLMAFIQKVMSEYNFVKVTDQVLPFFNELSMSFNFPNSFLLRRLRNPVFKQFIINKLTERNTMNAMLKNTVAVTALSTPANGVNVIPDHASAILDIRLLPGENSQAIFEDIRKMGRYYNIEAKRISDSEPTETTANTPLFKTIKGVVHASIPNSRVAPYLSPGATDSRFFREKGFICYGIIPILISLEEVSLLHGTDEYITINNVEMGINLLTQIVLQMNL